MTIEDNKKYKLTGEQIKDLASRISILSSESDEKAEKAQTGSTAPTTSTPGEIGQLYIQSDGTVYILKNIIEESGQPDEYTWEEVGAGTEYTAGDGISILNSVISATNTGKAKILTAADYNWNYITKTTTNPNCVALWLLEPGLYARETSTPGGNNLTIAINNTSSDTPFNGEAFIVTNMDTTVMKEKVILAITTSNIKLARTNAETGNKQMGPVKILTASDVANRLDTTSGGYVLDARQGKVLKDLIDSIAIRGAGAPTTSTVGQVGTLYEDTTNGKLYQCTDTTGGSYTWTEVGAGGGGSGITELTSADYNYDYGSTGTNNCIALWLLSEGTYSWATTLRSSVRVTTTETAGDLSADGALVIAASDATLVKVYLYGDGSATTVTGRNILQMYRVNKTNGTSNVSGAAITTRELKQSTGNSQSDIMSQNAVTSTMYADPNTTRQIKINQNRSLQNNPIMIGSSASAVGDSIAIGPNANANAASGQYPHNIAIGAYAGFSAPNGAYRVMLGAYSKGGSSSVAIGSASDSSSPTHAEGTGSVAIGVRAHSEAVGSIALGFRSHATSVGEMNIGSVGSATYGYNNSEYRLLTGLYDPQTDHDAATKGYVDNSLLGKQDALTAGSGISIADESGSLVISTTVAEPDEFTSSEWNALWS